MTVRAVVVDDEPLARRRLWRLLAEHPDIELVGEASDGEAAVEIVLRERPHVLFLDVRMPGEDGLSTLRRLRDDLSDELRPLAVFTTAYEEHAVEAFALEGTDYLVKPIDRQQLTRALRRVRQRLSADQGADAAAEEAGRPEAATGRAKLATGHLAGHRAGKIVNLQLKDVACIAVEDTITWAYTPQGRYRLKLALHEAEERLRCPPFVRVSRSSVINLVWVDHIAPMFSGTYVAVMRPGIGLEVHVSRRRARDLRELMGW